MDRSWETGKWRPWVSGRCVSPLVTGFVHYSGVVIKSVVGLGFFGIFVCFDLPVDVEASFVSQKAEVLGLRAVVIVLC